VEQALIIKKSAISETGAQCPPVKGVSREGVRKKGISSQGVHLESLWDEKEEKKTLREFFMWGDRFIGARKGDRKNFYRPHLQEP